MASSSLLETTSMNEASGGSVPQRRKFFLIVNKRAGNYVKWFVQPRIGEFLATEGVAGEVHYLFNTRTLKQKLDSAYEEGFRRYVVVGGDGTVSLVATLLRGRECTIGIVPTGTSNMLAQMLRIPITTRRAFELLLSSENSRPVDALDVDGRLFFLNASAGLSSFSISDLRTIEKSYLKLLAYVLAVIRSMRKARTRTFRVTVDGEERFIQAAELFVDNAGALWMPRYRTSDAQLDDGTAEVCYVQKGTPVELLNAVLDVLLVRKKRHSIRHMASAVSVSIDCDDAIPVQADGDAIASTPVSISVIPAAARFIVRPAC
jgi:diacylglycerol kinase (ATP)